MSITTQLSTTSFSEVILKAINDYRSFLRRNHRPVERRNKLKQFGLDGRYSELPDAALYHAASLINQDLESTLSGEQNAYSGQQQFHHHLSRILNQYEVLHDKVTHCGQLASRASIESIQLLMMDDNKLRDPNVIKKLAQANHNIAKYGNEAQHQQHINHLKNNRSRNEPFFDGILNNFLSTLEQIKSGNLSTDEPIN